jgi:hypothetical protein
MEGHLTPTINLFLAEILIPQMGAIVATPISPDFHALRRFCRPESAGF